MAQIRLFSTYYEERNKQRAKEYQHCLESNVKNMSLSAVYILQEGNSQLSDSSRLILRSTEKRPTYNDFFSWINEISCDSDYSIIANTDISFDNSIEIVDKFSWESNSCLALSRWDVNDTSKSILFEHGDSQDVWIFKGKIRKVNGDFPLGVYDCDNKIAWELEQAGYRVINPCYAVRTYHHHQCGYRSYEKSPPPDYGIRPPFRYVEPDNYWGPLRAWQIKRELNLNYFPWMMTRRRFWRYPVPKLAIRVWNKACKILGRTAQRDTITIPEK